MKYTSNYAGFLLSFIAKGVREHSLYASFLGKIVSCMDTVANRMDLRTFAKAGGIGSKNNVLLEAQRNTTANLETHSMNVYSKIL